MNKKNTLIIILLLSHLLLPFIAQSNNINIEKKDDEPLIYFNFEGEKIIDIINRLTALKQINLLLPSDQKNLIETTVTFKVPHKIKISDAWEMTVTLLNIAGFAVIQRNPNLYRIEPKTNIGKCNAPFYVNVSTDVLPNSNSIIRYLFYFQNIFLKEKGIKENLSLILKDMIPAQNTEQNFSLNESSNSLLITAESIIIKGIINLIEELDQSGFREAIEVIPIINTNANEIVSIINKLISEKKDTDQFRFPPMLAESNLDRKTYFSSSTRIVSIPQTNSVAIFGLYDSVQRVKDFIAKYLDKKVDADKTVLHVKPLKYLKAEDFSQTLQSLIKQQRSQSTGEATEKILGQDIRIFAEKQETAKTTKERQVVSAGKVDIKLEGVTKNEGPIIGGNNIIIACNQRDWKILDKLIDSLDREQWQVAIEVLIVDMTIATSNKIGTQLRRMHNETKLHEFKWQLANIDKPMLDFTRSTSPYPVDTTTGIEADLLSTQYASNGTAYNIVNHTADAGSTIFSFKDANGMAAIFELLNSFEDAKIVTQPFIIAKNNEQAVIVQSDQRFVQGLSDPASTGGTSVINYEFINAVTSVTILPRINMLANNINLEIQVAASEFLSSTDNTIRSRYIQTNANVGHKEVLVLGGISEMSVDESLNKLPILSKIPILGYLFKQQSETRDQRNLMIFISPARIPPVSMSNASKKISKFTQNKVDQISQELIKSDGTIGCSKGYENSFEKTENFQCLEDPITNFMFKPTLGSSIAGDLKSYAERGVWTPDFGESIKKTESFKGMNKAQQQKILQSLKNDAPTKSEGDPLKDLLQNEENPIKQAAA